MSEPVDGAFQGAPRLGAMFGRYRIDSLIGRGGMGMVFRATDTDLDRAVALKFLAPELPADPATRDRFVRESRLAAAIEHPHIVPVYEAGTVSGTMFIAMRYVHGQDLAQVLRREAPLDLARILDIVGQLADALDAAHAHGLIHRDVKPANVLLEYRGGEWAWLSDFGLTRRIGGTTPSVADGLAGSIDYMAPEAIQGGAVDGRADQYSLACLVFHCLTGAAPFGGETEASVLYAHVHQEPPSLAGHRSDTNGSLDAALGRALAKDPQDRFPDCQSFVAALRGDLVPASVADPPRAAVASSEAADGVVAPPVRRRAAMPGRRRAVIGALMVALAVAVSAYLLANGRSGEPSVTPQPPGSPLVGSAAPSGPVPLVSDAGVIVFAGDGGGNYDIWAVLPDGTGLQQLTHGSVRERMPDVSPDGTKIVFAAGRNGARDLYLMNADGSGRERLTRSSADDYSPAFSPDGRSIAWVSDSPPNVEDLMVMTKDGDGFVERTARNITNQAGGDNNHEDLDPAWFPDGRRIAFASNRAESSDIWVVDASGDKLPSPRTLDGLDDRDHSPTVGPDGEIVFVGERGGDPDSDLYLIPGPGDTPRRLTDSPAREESPDFSPTGDELVFAQDGPGADSRLIITTAAGDHPRRIRIDMPNAVDPAWVGRLGPLEANANDSVNGT